MLVRTPPQGSSGPKFNSYDKATFLNDYIGRFAMTRFVKYSHEITWWTLQNASRKTIDCLIFIMINNDLKLVRLKKMKTVGLWKIIYRWRCAERQNAYWWNTLFSGANWKITCLHVPWVCTFLRSLSFLCSCSSIVDNPIKSLQRIKVNSNHFFTFPQDC